MRGQRFLFEEVGQPVLLGRKAGLQVEIPFILEDRFSQGGDVVGRQA